MEIFKIDKEKLLSEINLLYSHKHKYINKILGYSEVDSSIFIISKYNESSNLFNLIHEKKKNLPIETLKFFVKNIVEAINYLHRKNIKITYKDLKLQSVYISNDGTYAFLDDFGFSKHFFTNKTKNKKHCGTIYYMAPELLIGGDFDYPADIYCLGMILYELFSTEIPYKNKTDMEIIKLIVGNQRPNMNCLRKETPAEYLDLINICLHQDPNKRPSALDLLYYLG